MKKTHLFIAMSLDGYIADDKGGVDWVQGQGNDHENIDTYSEFIKNIDTILMGWNTYYQIVTELSIGEWIYNDMITYVITHRKKNPSKQIRFTNMNPVDLIKSLREENGKDIWICGGAHLVQQLINDDLIDYYYITIIPTLLGSGVRLFGDRGQEMKLRLINVRSYNGMTDLVYKRR
jgi:Dihydrofolate reductase